MLLDWDIVIREKNLVKCSDERPCGNIIAEHNDNIFVIKGETVITREYMIPKSKITIMMGRNFI